MRRLILLVLLSWCASAAPVHTLHWPHARLLDRGGWLENQDVQVVDGRLQVKPATAEGGSTVWLVPGFIDAHVHLALSDPEKVWRGGCTTVRDLGWDPNDIEALQKKLKRPQLLVAGPILCAPDGYPRHAGWCPPTTAVEVDSPEVARLVLTALETDVIKVSLAGPGPTLSLKVLQAIVQAAHERHRQVTAHVSTAPELEKAIEAGVDELAHFMFDDTVVTDAQLDRMVKHGMRVCPTLHIRPSAPRLDNLRRFVKRGGTVIYGTDLGNYGPPPGIDVKELELMQQAGMTPLQIVASATWGSAAALGLKDRGRLATGLRADVLVLKADPLQDLQAFGQLQQVVCGGQ